MGLAEIDDGRGDPGCGVEEKEAQDGNQDDPPEVRKRRFEAGGERGGVLHEAVFVAKKKVLQLLLVSWAQMVAIANLMEELARRGLRGKTGDGGAELFGLLRDARAGKQDQCRGTKGQDGVYDRDGTKPVAHGAFKAGDERIEKVGEKNGKEEKRKRAAGAIKEEQHHRKEQRGEEDAESAGVPEFLDHGCVQGSE